MSQNSVSNFTTTSLNPTNIITETFCKSTPIVWSTSSQQGQYTSRKSANMYSSVENIHGWNSITAYTHALIHFLLTKRSIQQERKKQLLQGLHGEGRERSPAAGCSGGRRLQKVVGWAATGGAAAPRGGGRKSSAAATPGGGRQQHLGEATTVLLRRHVCTAASFSHRPRTSLNLNRRAT